MCTTTQKRKAEVGEVMWWDWTQAHIMMIRRNLEDEPAWELLPKAFKQRIDFLWAPYSEVSIAQVKDYDPRNPKHQVSLVGLYMHELFTGGFRRGLQNQREHKAWCQQRKIDELIRDLK